MSVDHAEVDRRGKAQIITQAGSSITVLGPAQALVGGGIIHGMNFAR